MALRRTFKPRILRQAGRKFARKTCPPHPLSIRSIRPDQPFILLIFCAGTSRRLWPISKVDYLRLRNLVGAVPLNRKTAWRRWAYMAKQNMAGARPQMDPRANVYKDRSAIDGGSAGAERRKREPAHGCTLGPPANGNRWKARRATP